MSVLGKLTHDLLGWHQPIKGSEYLPHMDISLHAICKYCGKRILQDSQGNWFLSAIQDKDEE